MHELSSKPIAPGVAVSPIGSLPQTIVPLEDSVVDAIAAGEVIERPSSILKELLDNALDAGANEISIHVAIDLESTLSQTIDITVEDNGTGIESKSLPLVFERHATSKVRDIDDLIGLSSHGFRGEAMASIAAVADVSVETTTRHAQNGSYIRSINGQLASGSYNGPPGTRVTVSKVFSRTPVRKRFLKSSNVELKRCLEIVRQAAFCAPACEITAVVGKHRFHAPKELDAEAHTLTTPDLLQGLTQRATRFVSDTKGVTNLATIHRAMDADGYGLVGASASPEYGLRNRSGLLFAINNRCVSMSKLTTTLRTAFRNRMLRGTYPVTMLHLFVPKEEIDINVHPQKLEVRLKDERRVQAMLLKTLDGWLAESPWRTQKPRKTYTLKRPDTVQDQPSRAYVQSAPPSAHSLTPRSLTPQPSLFTTHARADSRTDSRTDSQPMMHDAAPKPFSDVQPRAHSSHDITSHDIASDASLGHSMDRYYCADGYLCWFNKDGLTLFDAAGYLASFARINTHKNAQEDSRLMVLPERVSNISAQDIQKLNALGFETHSMGANTIIIRKRPAWLPLEVLSDFVDARAVSDRPAVILEHVLRQQSDLTSMLKTVLKERFQASLGALKHVTRITAADEGALAFVRTHPLARVFAFKT